MLKTAVVSLITMDYYGIALIFELEQHVLFLIEQIFARVYCFQKDSHKKY